MSKGIMNRRDKMIWDNSALPTIDDAITACTYTAGDGISIDEDNVISATGGGVNYSTTEHVVGTWIDGSDLYEVTFEITPTSSSSPLYYSTYGISNVDKIVYAYGINLASVGTIANGYTGSTNAYGVTLQDITSTYLTYAVGSSILNGKLYITIRYTKTTD